MTDNPVIAVVKRGSTVESRHRGAFAVSDRSGRIVRQAGDIKSPVFPRSAIKPCAAPRTMASRNTCASPPPSSPRRETAKRSTSAASTGPMSVRT